MSDIISRADAIDAVWKLDKDANEYVVDDAKEIHGYCTAIGVCVGELSKLPSAEAEWIPCSDKLPSNNDCVLVTYKWGDDDYETSELDYWVTKHEAENGNEKCKRLIDHVIAWRRMPGPYKEGE